MIDVLETLHVPQPGETRSKTCADENDLGESLGVVALNRACASRVLAVGLCRTSRPFTPEVIALLYAAIAEVAANIQLLTPGLDCSAKTTGSGPLVAPMPT